MTRSCGNTASHGAHVYMNTEMRPAKCDGTLQCLLMSPHLAHTFYLEDSTYPQWCIGRQAEEFFCGDMSPHITHAEQVDGVIRQCIGDTLETVKPNFLIEIFERQLAFQQDLGYDFSEMLEEERVWYAKDQILALLDETHEALGEIGWKSWATSRHFNRDAFVGELIDALHFLVNLFLVAECTPQEMYQRYIAKNEKNRTRQDKGYDGVTDKCPGCKRAYDDDAVKCYPSTPSEMAYCDASGVHFKKANIQIEEHKP